MNGRAGAENFTQRRKGGAQRAQRKELNRKDRKEKTRRTQRNTRTPCGLCVFLAPFAVQLFSLRETSS
jgi:hypothetical protein